VCVRACNLDIYLSIPDSKPATGLPGSPLFNLLGGALFGVPVGFVVCLVCTSLGTALCYFFFNVFGGPIVRWLFLEQVTFPGMHTRSVYR
jgi:uncharacterized membrane protein YdjX (TVP38/TMEM64 family)